MGAFSFWHIVVVLLYTVGLGVPIAAILHRAGRSRWWVILVWVPLVNFIGLWLFAFSRWPAVDRAPDRT